MQSERIRAAASAGAGTACSIAVSRAQRPSPESSTYPASFASSGSFSRRRCDEVEQPRPHDAALPPDLGDLRDVDIEIGGAHQVEALGVRLHEPVLDRVVNHLHVVTGAGRAHVRVAVRRGKRLEDWFEAIEGLARPPHHQTEALLESPDAARRSGVEKENVSVPQSCCVLHRVRVTRVTAVYQYVAGSRSDASSPIVFEVISPEGTIIHIARGDSSFAASSSKTKAGSAPPSAAFATASASTSKATTS